MKTALKILKSIKEDINNKFESDPLIIRTVNLIINEFEQRSKKNIKKNKN